MARRLAEKFFRPLSVHGQWGNLERWWVDAHSRDNARWWVGAHSRGARRWFKRGAHGDPLIFNQTKLPEQSSHPNNPVTWVGRVNNGRPIEQAATGVCLCGSKVMECQNFRLHWFMYRISRLNFQHSTKFARFLRAPTKHHLSLLVPASLYSEVGFEPTKFWFSGGIRTHKSQVKPTV